MRPSPRPLIRRGAVIFVVAAILAAFPPASDGQALPATTAAPTDTLRALIAAGEYAAAESLGRVVLSEVEAAHGAEAVETARVLDLLVEALRRGGKSSDPGARTFAERAVRIKETALGPEHADVAASLNVLGGILFVNDDPAGARKVYERALAIREKTLPAGDPDIGRSLLNLGNVLRAEGDYAAARPTYQRALAVLEAALGPDHPHVASALNNLAVLLRETGDYAAALPLYERAVATKEKALGPDHPDLAGSLTNLANLLSWLGRYEESRALYERALAIREAALGPDHADVATTLNSLGSLLHNAGDFEAALPLYERALAIREKSFGAEHTEVAWSLGNLGLLKSEMGDAAGARNYLEKSLAIWEKVVGPEHPEAAAARTDLGLVLQKSGDYAAAEAHLGRALRDREAALGADHPDVATSLHNLAALENARGAFDRALPLFERAVSIRRQVLGSTHHDVAASLAGLSVSQLETGDAEAALRTSLAAEETGRENVRLLTRTLAEREALRYAAARVDALSPAIAIVVGGDAPDGSTTAVWNEIVRSRAIVLDQMASRHRDIVALGTPEADAVADTLRTVRTQLANLTVRGRETMDVETYEALLQRLRREKDLAERQLARLSRPGRGEEKRNFAGYDDVFAALPREGALVAFAQYADHATTPTGAPRPAAVPSYAAFVVVQGREPVALRLGPVAEIDPLIKAWRGLAAEPPDSDEKVPPEALLEAGRALRKSIWDPVARHLSGATQVFVVMDGALNAVALGALPDDAGGWLVESGPTLHYLSAERDLIDMARAEASGLLALGGPDYDAHGLFAQEESNQPTVDGTPIYRGALSNCPQFSMLRFESLPGSRLEVARLVDLWMKKNDAGTLREATLELTGPRADETTFKQRAPGRRLIHVATHGFFLGSECVSAPGSSRGVGGLVAAPTAGAPRTPATGNPLLLSGLAFAGANHRNEAGPGEDDGILTAEEIAAIDLSRAEWVVLSACDTGLGETAAGEGVFGLRRAFEVAGAGTLIMSLWAVDDEATRDWMTALYEERLIGGKSTVDSVRNASLRVLAERRARGVSTHPFYWGGFVAAGNWR